MSVRTPCAQGRSTFGDFENCFFRRHIDAPMTVRMLPTPKERVY